MPHNAGPGYEPQAVARGDEVVDLETRIRLRMEAHQAKLQAHRQKRQQNARWDDVDTAAAVAAASDPSTSTSRPKTNPNNNDNNNVSGNGNNDNDNPESDIARLTSEIARIDDELRHASVLATPSRADGTTVSDRQAEAFVDSVFALREHESLKLSVSDLNEGGNDGQSNNAASSALLSGPACSRGPEQPTIADRGAEWLKKREDKIAGMAAKQSQKLEGAVQATPQINAKSRQIAAYRKKQTAEVSSRLYGLARQKEKERQRREAAAERERAQAKPRLYGDKNRRHNAWQGNVADRLYQEAKLRSKRQTALAEHQRQEEISEMEEHQRFLFSRRQSADNSKGPTAGSQRSTAALIGEDLMRRGEISRLKKQQAREREELRIKMAAAAPKTNSVSKRLLKSKRSKGGKAPSKVYDRLYAQGKEQEEKARRKKAAADAECTFQPRIDEHSRDLAAQNRAKSSIPQDRDGNSIFSPNKGPGGMPSSTLYKQSSLASRKAQKKLQRLKDEKEEKFRADHTFKPKLAHSHHVGARKGGAAEDGPRRQGSSVVERLQLWQQERDKKLHFQRIQQREQALAGYTFEPHFTTVEYQKQQEQQHEQNQLNRGSGEIGSDSNPTLRKALNKLLELIQSEETENELVEIFRLRDVNGRGQLRTSQFVGVLKEFGLTLSDSQWEALITALAEHNGGSGTSPGHVAYEYLGEKALDILCDAFAIPGAGGTGGGDGLGGVGADDGVHNLSEVEQVHPGISRFIQRQEAARAERRRRANIPHSTGEAWTGRQTIPVSPKFNVRAAGTSADSSGGASRGSYASAHAPSDRSGGPGRTGYSDLAREKQLYSQLFRNNYTPAAGTSSNLCSNATKSAEHQPPDRVRDQHTRQEPRNAATDPPHSNQGALNQRSDNIFSQFLVQSSPAPSARSGAHTYSGANHAGHVAGVHISRQGSIDISFLERSTDQILGEENFEAAQLDRWTENVIKEEEAVRNTSHRAAAPAPASSAAARELPSASSPMVPLAGSPEHVTYIPHSRRPLQHQSEQTGAASLPPPQNEEFPAPGPINAGMGRAIPNGSVFRPPLNPPSQQQPPSPFRPSMTQSEREKRTLQKFHERMRKAQNIRKKRS